MHSLLQERVGEVETALKRAMTDARDGAVTLREYCAFTTCRIFGSFKAIGYARLHSTRMCLN